MHESTAFKVDNNNLNLTKVATNNIAHQSSRLVTWSVVRVQSCGIPKSTAFKSCGMHESTAFKVDNNNLNLTNVATNNIAHQSSRLVTWSVVRVQSCGMPESTAIKVDNNNLNFTNGTTNN
ncbi:hypothetical protein J6590_090774 [Homalodisca vitripennis]|nr:hypothetical protein J6590_090774 [Homalodisca vitripennis]